MNVLEKIGRMKYILEEDFDKESQAIFQEISSEFETIMRGDES